ncbi:MAG: hypothetical protein ACRENJ_11200 [Candidatus Eiseniibacteriota bacterium]
MPFTPFHFGPGLLLKGAAPRDVSLAAFVASQVAVDLEPLYFILRGEYPVHRWLHTVWGGGLVGLAVGVALSAGARRWIATAPPAARGDLRPRAGIVGGLLGGISHPLLDGLMHPDVRALRPFAETTWVLEPGGVAALHLGCVIAGVLGVLLLVARRARA